MDLFNPNTLSNLLPYDGEVYYHGPIMALNEAEAYYQTLMNSIEWKHDEAMMFGKKIITKRKVAWYGDKPYDYTYSKITKKALPWTKELLALKAQIEDISKHKFNSCLINLYHTGEEGMAYHSDDEKKLMKNGAIASLSFGAIRKFAFKHKENKVRVDLVLEKGSLLLMEGTTQTFWTHRLPPTKKVLTPRINLTFRNIVE